MSPVALPRRYSRWMPPARLATVYHSEWQRVTLSQYPPLPPCHWAYRSSGTPPPAVSTSAASSKAMCHPDCGRAWRCPSDPSRPGRTATHSSVAVRAGPCRADSHMRSGRDSAEVALPPALRRPQPRRSGSRRTRPTRQAMPGCTDRHGLRGMLGARASGFVFRKRPRGGQARWTVHRPRRSR